MHIFPVSSIQKPEGPTGHVHPKSRKENKFIIYINFVLLEPLKLYTLFCNKTKMKVGLMEKLYFIGKALILIRPDVHISACTFIRADMFLFLGNPKQIGLPNVVYPGMSALSHIQMEKEANHLL